ncbi:MAG: T9SS type A sorting domain-containing protein [Flavobacteriales bacterium]|nr:T9SS type A sorting domain-containing protein [Flavobacteriales bacterium]
MVKSVYLTVILFFAIAMGSIAQSTDSEPLEFMFSPNPVRTDCYVEVNQPVTLMLLDLRGEVVLKKDQFTKGDLDLRNLSEGVYFLQFVGKSGIRTQRLVRSNFRQ